MSAYIIIEDNNQIKVQKQSKFLFFEFWNTCTEFDFLSDLHPPYHVTKSDMVFISNEEAEDWIKSQTNQSHQNLYNTRRNEHYENLLQTIRILFNK